MNSLTKIRTTVLCAVLLATAQTAFAENVLVRAPVLEGAQEVPPVTSAGTGSVNLVVDDVANTVVGGGEYSGVGSAVTMVHIHGPAAVGVPAGIILGLTHTGGTSGTISLSPTPISAADVAILLSGQAYINVHTVNNGGGELRGQLFQPPRSTCTGEFFGGSCDGQCPCLNTASIGTGGGCTNPEGRSARLDAIGIPSVSIDSLRVRLAFASSSSFAILVSGDNLLPTSGPCPPGGGIQGAQLDGLRCVGGGVLRHGSRATDATGNVGVTNAGWGPPAGPPGGIAASGGFVAGQNRHFQGFYRVSPFLGCGTGQNTSDATSVTFIP